MSAIDARDMQFLTPGLGPLQDKSGGFSSKRRGLQRMQGANARRMDDWNRPVEGPPGEQMGSNDKGARISVDKVERDRRNQRRKMEMTGCSKEPALSEGPNVIDNLQVGGGSNNLKHQKLHPCPCAAQSLSGLK